MTDPQERMDTSAEKDSDVGIGRFVQAAPKAAEERKATSEMEFEESRDYRHALSEEQLSEDADGLLCWLCRYPVEKNHPRATTDTVPLWKCEDVAAVHFDEKVPAVFEKLIAEGFLSCPVLGANHRYMGFIDMLDLVCHALSTMGAWAVTDASSLSNLSPERRRAELERLTNVDAFRSATVEQVMGQSAAAVGGFTRNPFHPVFKGFSLFHVVELMARSRSVHRVPVITSDNKVCSLITQSMVISLFDQNMDKFGEIKDRCVQGMLSGLTPVVHTVEENDVALTAFKKMATDGVSGLGVVNSAGELVDGISIRDLRTIGGKAEHFDRMWQTVKEYKAHAREQFKQQTPHKPIHVLPSDTLQTVISRMDDGNIHRVFVVNKKDDGALIPIAMISQRDVLRFCMFEMGLVPAPIEL